MHTLIWLFVNEKMENFRFGLAWWKVSQISRGRPVIATPTKAGVCASILCRKCLLSSLYFIDRFFYIIRIKIFCLWDCHKKKKKNDKRDERARICLKKKKSCNNILLFPIHRYSFIDEKFYKWKIKIHCSNTSCRYYNVPTYISVCSIQYNKIAFNYFVDEIKLKYSYFKNIFWPKFFRNI